MSRLRFILPLLFVCGAVLGQVTTVGTIANGESGSSVRAKLNTITGWDTHINADIDSTTAHRTELDAHLDSIAQHRTELDIHLDSVAALRASIILNDAAADNLLDSVAVHRTALDNATDSLSAHDTKINANIDNISDGVDSLAVHDTKINTNIDDISDGVDSLAVHDTKINTNIDAISDHDDTITVFRTALDNATDSLSVHDTKINANLQSASDNADSITAHDTKINTNIDDISDGVDSLGVHRTELDEDSDSLVVHRTDIDINTDTTRALRTDIVVNTDSIRASADSVTIHRDDLADLFARVEALEGKKTSDNTAPYLTDLDAFYADVVDLSFQEDIVAQIEDSIIAAFSYTADATPITIDSLDVIATPTAANILRLYTDSVSAGQTLLLSYARPDSGGIHDAVFNYTISWTDSTVTNSVLGVDTTWADALYLFENNSADSSGWLRDATFGNYYGSASPPEGAAYAAINNSDRDCDMPVGYELPDSAFSVVAWFKSANSGATYEMLDPANHYYSNQSSFTWRINEPSGYQEFVGYVGGTPNTVRSANSSVDISDWKIYCITYNGTTGEVELGYDGAFLTPTSDDSVTHTDLVPAGPYRLGEYAYFLWDAVHVYPFRITEEQFAAIKVNPDSMVGLIGEAPNPIPPTPDDTSWLVYADSIMAADFEEIPTGHFSLGDAFNAWDVTEILYQHGFGQWLDTRDSSLYIIEDDGNNLLRQDYDSGQYGNIVRLDDPIGSGHHFLPKIPGDQTEVWISQNVYKVGPFVPPRGGKAFGGGAVGGEYVSAGRGDQWETDCDGGPCNGFNVSVAFEDWDPITRTFNSDIRYLTLYIYHVDQVGLYGDQIFFREANLSTYYTFPVDE